MIFAVLLGMALLIETACISKRTIARDLTDGELWPERCTSCGLQIWEKPQHSAVLAKTTGVTYGVCVYYFVICVSTPH